jgi:hypothetical protein
VTNQKVNGRINVLLVIFLLLTIVTLRGPRTVSVTGTYSTATYIHAASGAFLMIGVLAHLWLHRAWFRSYFAGRMKGKAKGRLIANSCTGFFVLLASLSGYAEISSPQPNALHHVAGFLAILGMIPHTIRGIGHRLRATSGRPTSHQGRTNTVTDPQARGTRTARLE